MKRGSSTALGWLLRVLVVVVVVVVVVVDPVDLGAPTQERDTATVTNYSAAYVVSGDGHLDSTETITVQMPSGKRGIYRIFDTKDPRGGPDHPVEVERVERDGRSEPYTEVDSAPGTRSIRIGNASVFLDPGSHQYVIESSTVDVLESGTGELEGTTLWWWDVVGSGWAMPMDSVEVTAELPAEPLEAECVTGEDGACTATVDGTTLRLTAESLDPFTPITVRVQFDPEVVPAPPGPTDLTWLVVAASVLSAALGIALGVAALRVTHEKQPGFPVLFEPPFMVTPALGVKVLDEVPSSHALQATLFALAERGLLVLDGGESSWRIDVVGDPGAQELSPDEAAVLRSLGLAAVGDSFTISRSVASGQKISAADTALRHAVRRMARPYLHTSGWGLTARAASMLAVVAVIGLGGWYVFFGGPALWPVLTGAAGYALVAAPLVFDRGARTVRTKEGRDLWSRVGGFARFLTTDSSEARFDAAARLDWFPRYLPWAVALGVADKWAARYETQGVEPPAVPWLLYGGVAHAYSPRSMSSFTSSFDKAISDASAAYSASQSSSGSSGGGGFSGGSGGGGGGGGSW